MRDAVQLGKAKAVFNLGHFNWEALGMKYAQEWISDPVDGQVPVNYVPSEDLYVSMYQSQGMEMGGMGM